MKSVQEFFGEEKRRPNAGPTKDAIEDARKKLTQQFNRPSRVTSNPSGYTITNMPGGNIPDEQKFSQLEKLAKQRQSKSAAAASDVDVESRTKASNTAARARETRPAQRRKLGDTTKGGPVKTFKPSQPAPAPKPEAIKQSSISVKQAAYRKKVATQGSNLLRSIQRGGETTTRMGRGYNKSLATTGDAIIKGIGDERRAETAAGNKEFKQQRYGKGKSGPATNLRTPAQTKTYQTGVKKGYFDPKTGRISSSGLQRHINMRAVGGENFGKFKGRDPRQALANVSDAIKRAQSGDRTARSEIRRSYKSITAKYKPETGARTARTGGSEGFRTFQQQVANVDAPKLTPQRMSMPLPGTQQKPVSSPAAQATKEKLRQKLDLKLNARSQKGGALGFPVQTSIVPSKAGELVKGTKGGKIVKGTEGGNLVAPSKPTAQPRTTSYTGIGGGKRVEVAGAPKKTKTALLPSGTKPSRKTSTVDIPSTYTPPKVDKGPSIDVTEPKPTNKVSYKQFTKQQGASKTRSGAWSYNPSASKKTQDVVKQSLKQSNPARYNRKLQTRAKNISNIRTNRALGALGNLTNVGFAGYDAYNIYKQQKERGQSTEYATKRAIAQAGGGAVGAEMGAKLGSKLLPGKLKILGGLAGGVLGYMGGEKVGKALVGASEKDKQWMRNTNRSQQSGVGADQAQFKTGNKAIIKDASGKERVGYKSYEGGKTVYKHGLSPTSRYATSSNPLERLGRSTARSGIPFVSDFLAKRYAAGDEATRKRNVAAVKSAASK